jgi:hypothetical protein
VYEGVAGAVVLVRPAALADAVPSLTAGRPRALVRLLGLRMLAQAAVTAALPTKAVIHAGAGVDLLHGASMVALAVGSPRYRSAAATSAVVAVGFAGAGLRTLR